MALASRLFGGVLLLGVGVGVIVLAANAPRLMRAARPVLRESLKLGLQTYAVVRSAAVELAEDIEDLTAEVRAEVKQAREPGPAADA